MERIEIDNLPPDILTGDYEFELRMGKDLWEHGFSFLDVIKTLFIENTYVFRYRKPEPKTPTHEEIMSKWWKIYGTEWVKVIEYQPFKSKCYYTRNLQAEASFFTDRESADIPPEHKT